MEARASLKKAQHSAQKARLVADQIRSQSVENALQILAYSHKKVAYDIKKLLESAVANAEYHHSVDIDDLKVSEIYVNEGSSLKRIRPRAKGRAYRIIKQTCHINLAVSDNK